jgi:hypothetical protein
MLASPMVGVRSPRVGRCKHLLPQALSLTHCIPPRRPPDHAPQCWRPLSHVQVFSHCAEPRCLPSSALAIRSRCGFAEMWGMVRATARVPTPLHTSPALTMRTKGSRFAADHCKGGGERLRGAACSAPFSTTLPLLGPNQSRPHNHEGRTPATHLVA